MKHLLYPKRSIIFIPIIIFILDLITKIIAYNFLPFQDYVYIFSDKIGLYLTYNTGASGGHLNFLAHKTEINKNVFIFWLSFNCLIFSIYIFVSNKTNILNKKNYLLAFSVLNILLLIILLDSLNKQIFSDYFISWFSKVGTVSFLICLSNYVKDQSYKLLIYCLISSGLANLLSHFYSPYRVIDFIYIKGSYEYLKIGYFNIADLSFYASIILFVILEISRSKNYK